MFTGALTFLRRLCSHMGGPSHGEAKQDTRGARGEWHSMNSNGHIYRFLLKQESGKIITHIKKKKKKR